MSGSETTAVIPAVAAAVGYDTETFGPAVTLGQNWQKFDFFGTNTASIPVTQNADGSVTINPGGDNYGAQLSTASVGTTPTNWTGEAFGGGAYFQATMSFTGPASFWANDVENMATASTTGQSVSPSWIEADIAEFDSTGVYGFALHNWYSTANGNQAVSTVNSGSPVFPAGADYTVPNTYGMLWIPATATTQGYVKWYFDGQQVGNTIYWNQYNPNDPATANPYSVMDSRHMALILGTGSNSSATVYNVGVAGIGGERHLYAADVNAHTDSDADSTANADGDPVRQLHRGVREFGRRSHRQQRQRLDDHSGRSGRGQRYDRHDHGQCHRTGLRRRRGLAGEHQR